MATDAKEQQQPEASTTIPPPAVEPISDADSNASSSSSDSESDSGGASPGLQPVEWLATGRSKRSTAGNRMSAMLANEEPADEDSDLELLFQEDADDAGFTDNEDKDDGSDAQMESSDDEDENEAQDDLEGEKELERQAKEKRAVARKRKAQEAIPARFRKKVRISQPPETPTTTTAAAQPKPRPKKKSERTSWLPTAADMPTRASERSTTRLSKEQLHQQMVEREARRKRQVELMEKKAKKMEAMKKPPMTQEERLKEAAIVEKRNSKSLNRWEEAEKQREEERRAKLAALNNRRLEGPVVTFLSNIVDLSEVQLKHVGRMVSIEEKPKRKRPSTAAAKVAAEIHVATDSTPRPSTANTTATASPKPETGMSTTAPPTPATKEGPGLPTEAETSQQAQKPLDNTIRVAVEEEVPPAKEPVSEAPVLQPVSEEAPEPSPAASQVPTAQPAPPTPIAAPDPAPVAVQPAPLAISRPFSPAAASSPSPAPPKPASTPATSVKAEPSIPKPIPLALRPDVGPRFMPPPNPHFALIAQPGVLAPPAGMPPGLASASMPSLGYSATPISRPTGLTTMPASLTPPPATPSPGPAPSKSPQPSVPTTVASFPPPFLPPSVLPPTTLPTNPPQPSPLVHTTASFQPIAAPASPISEPKKQQEDQPTATTTKKPPAKAPASRKPPPPPEPPEPEPPMEGKVTRSYIVLQDFDEDAIKKPEVQTQILFGRKMNKLAKPPHPPLCVITNHPAKYRDPETGLPYYNAYAYKEIRKLIQGNFKWSQLLGTWVDNSAEAATGVPTRFIRPETEEERKERLERKEQEKKQQQQQQAEAEAEAEAKNTMPAAVVASGSEQQQQQQKEAPSGQVAPQAPPGGGNFGSARFAPPLEPIPAANIPSAVAGGVVPPAVPLKEDVKPTVAPEGSFVAPESSGTSAGGVSGASGQTGQDVAPVAPPA